MNLRSRILIGLIMGTVGGFLGWLLQENLIHYSVQQDLLKGTWYSVPLSAGQVRTLIYCVGGLIGMCLGAVEGIVQSNPRKLLQGIGLGALTGVILGFMGYNFGGLLYHALGGSDEISRDAGIGAFARQVIARAFGWSLMGLGLGIGAALPTRSLSRIRNGAIGGFLGGFLGGFIFDLIAPASNVVQAATAGSGVREVGGPSRAVGFTAIGGLTGFFIGLVEEWLKQAWVKVLAGRNEGKDFILSKTVNILGRDERSDVPLYGDPSIGAQHAAIRTDGYRHILIDAGAPTGTLVNGQPVPSGGELLLRDGDMIQIGSQRILFREKATQSRVSPSAVDAPRAHPAGPMNTPMPGHLCPFCGGAKDASGNCLCTPAGSTPGMNNLSPGMSPNEGFTNFNGQPMAYSGGDASYDSAPGYAPSPFAAPIAAGRLLGLEGAIAGQVFMLSSPNMMLGREQGRDIVVVGDSTVSRTHARLSNENGQFMVYDNNSANGTFVNGVRVQMQALAPGDVVQFGSSKFRFE
jgi:pSer/pThr/pTyr-binding forkhead associated (FHA) protein